MKISKLWVCFFIYSKVSGMLKGRWVQNHPRVCCPAMDTVCWTRPVLKSATCECCTKWMSHRPTNRSTRGMDDITYVHIFACFIWCQRGCDWEPASSDGGDGEISRDAERSAEEERERVWAITPPDERASGQRTEVLLARFKHCISKLIQLL